MRAPGALGEAAAELLRDVVVTADLEQARRIVRENSAFKAVTKDGDLLGSHWAHGGAARPQSLFELRATADEAAAGLAGAQRRCDEAAAELAGAVQAEEAAGRAAEKDLARLEQLRRELLDAEGKATEAEEPDELPLEAAGSREDLADRCTAARNAEMEARLEVRTAEERLRAIDGRADSLTTAACPRLRAADL